MKFTAAILTGLLATATTFVSAAPASAIEERATCVEANRFGKFTLAQTQVKEGRVSVAQASAMAVTILNDTN